MTLTRLTLARIVVAVLVIWVVLGLVSLLQFHGGGSVPSDGRGDRIEGLQKSSP
jgi:hypothetical protein